MEGELGRWPPARTMAKRFFSRFTSARPKQISVFDGQDLKRAVLAGQAWLEQHREAINALNVFPVPDGDTGTNMTLTMRAATKDIADSSAAVGAADPEIFRRLLRGEAFEEIGTLGGHAFGPAAVLVEQMRERFHAAHGL